MESIKSILLKRRINLTQEFKKTFEREFNISPESKLASNKVKKDLEEITLILKSNKFETLPSPKKNSIMKEWVRKMHIFQEAINLGLFPFQVSGAKGGEQKK